MSEVSKYGPDIVWLALRCGHSRPASNMYGPYQLGELVVCWECGKRNSKIVKIKGQA